MPLSQRQREFKKAQIEKNNNTTALCLAILVLVSILLGLFDAAGWLWGLFVIVAAFFAASNPSVENRYLERELEYGLSMKEIKQLEKKAKMTRWEDW